MVSSREPADIDAELRLLAAVRRSVREHGGPLPSIGPLDELLEERAATDQPVNPH
jgi:hypothetical protein